MKFGLDEKVVKDIVSILEYKPDNVIQSYENFKKAFNKLKEFVDTDNGSEKDRGAIINAYQYTFELFWKTLQKYLQQQELLDELGPGSVIRTAFQYNIIQDGETYMYMLKDRNLVTYTYKEDVAEEIHNRIKEEYITELEKFIEYFDKKI